MASERSGDRMDRPPTVTAVRRPWEPPASTRLAGRAGDDRFGPSARAVRGFTPGDGDADAAGEGSAAFGFDLRLPSSRVGDAAGVLEDVGREDPATAACLSRAVRAEFPEPGTEFLGFHLLEELGRGAFGRVYLAKQGDLAGRLVALKVSAELQGESQTLAQLQHTNIVPIYSMHRAGALQGVCMPYFGATTLADLYEKLEARATLPASGEMLLSTLNSRRGGVRSLPAPEPSTRVVAAPDRAPAGSEPRALPRTGPGHDTLQMLGGLSYVEAVLWVASRLADGLAHAHERGILHRDLKPANILLTDEGQPMLLDFNLSADLKARSAGAAALGGTLPYMAPEHLEAFLDGRGEVDGRADLYALGIILFELLTGRHPFEIRRGGSLVVLREMIAERRAGAPDVRRWNRAVSPSVASIVAHCLEPDPARRYPGARALHEDLERQLASRPLRYAPEPCLRERARKWTRRHPRISSSTSVASVAAAVILGLGATLAARGERLARLEAAAGRDDFRGQVRTARYLLNSIRPADRGRGLGLCRAALRRFGTLDDPAWLRRPAVALLPEVERRALLDEVGDLLYLMAHNDAEVGGAAEALRLNRLAEACYPADVVPRSVWSQRAALLAKLGDEAGSARLGERARATPYRTARDRVLSASEEIGAGRFLAARPLLVEATRQDPRDFWAWFLLGVCHDRLGQDFASPACYDTAVALWPDFPYAWYDRGLARLRRGEPELAVADFDRALALSPDLADILIDRALGHQALRRLDAAVADLSKALELGAPPARVYYLRASIRQAAGDLDGARRDRELGARHRPADEMSWLARADDRLGYDPDGAVADYAKVLELNPRSLPALQNTSHLLADRPGRLRDALRAADRAVKFYPDYVPARSGRGVLLARLGKRTAALLDAEESLARVRSPEIDYQVAGIYAQTSREVPEDRREALHLLAAALGRGFGHDLLAIDPDLDPIRDDPQFRRLEAAARALRPAPPTTDR